MIVIFIFLANIRGSRFFHIIGYIIQYRSNSFIKEIVTIDETIVHFRFHFFMTNAQEEQKV